MTGRMPDGTGLLPEGEAAGASSSLRDCDPLRAADIVAAEVFAPGDGKVSVKLTRRDGCWCLVPLTMQPGTWLAPDVLTDEMMEAAGDAATEGARSCINSRMIREARLGKDRPASLAPAEWLIPMWNALRSASAGDARQGRDLRPGAQREHATGESRGRPEPIPAQPDPEKG